jgi:hypothetical protein
MIAFHMALHAHGLLCKFEQLPFGHFSIESHVHNLKYMHSSKHGLNDEAIPHKFKDD